MNALDARRLNARARAQARFIKAYPEARRMSTRQIARRWPAEWHAFFNRECAKIPTGVEEKGNREYDGSRQIMDT